MKKKDMVVTHRNLATTTMTLRKRIASVHSTLQEAEGSITQGVEEVLVVVWLLTLTSRMATLTSKEHPKESMASNLLEIDLHLRGTMTSVPSRMLHPRDTMTT